MNTIIIHPAIQSNYLGIIVDAFLFTIYYISNFHRSLILFLKYFSYILTVFDPTAATSLAQASACSLLDN